MNTLIIDEIVREYMMGHDPWLFGANRRMEVVLHKHPTERMTIFDGFDETQRMKCEVSFDDLGRLHKVDGPSVIIYDETGAEVEHIWWKDGKRVDIISIIENHHLSHDWRQWDDAEKLMVRLALP